ncbi:MAG: bis(5'-nucleosyl)-tetraphosphatase (symmetrical) YqeK [Bacillota bacterium]|nr:bis(5'-nucleosyl)-tetraphosphatase (symmetrical) YqeK [Bacillota bacterium]
MDLNILREEAGKKLGEKRFKHVLGCEKESEKLAKHWGANPCDARAAALLHDITKENDREEQLKFCENHCIIIGDIEKTEWKLLHAITAAELSRSVYNMPVDICEAVRYHTTGKENMTLLQKILYLADFIEPTRDFLGVVKLRRLAYRNLSDAMLYAFNCSIKDIMERDRVLHPDTVSGRNWILKEEIRK